jgi:hypothetical protein
MSLFRVALVCGLIALPAVPAYAAVTYCPDSRIGLNYAGYSEDDILDYQLDQLRLRGVDATRVEKWNGCLRAFVRQPGGGEIMEFYDPHSYRRVQ